MHTKVSEGDWVMGGGHPVYLPHLLRPAGQPGQGRQIFREQLLPHLQVTSCIRTPETISNVRNMVM